MQIRSGETVRRLRLSTRLQLSAVGVAACVVAAAGVTITTIAAEGAAMDARSTALARQGRSVADAADKVTRYRRSVDALAKELEARQDFMDDLYKTHFGNEAAGEGSDLVGAADKGDAATISMGPEAAPLLKIAQRQRQFARLMTHAVQRRSDKAAAAIRSFGLDPERLARDAARAQGGPFVPWTGDKGALTGELTRLADAMSRMEFLERSLIAIPSGKPTATPMLSSSYGYRRDPFNGHAAFHAGLDFPGRYGQPINAAAAGRVAYVGQRQGYGNVVEVDHGAGLMTRYAHLSGFSAHVGDKVARGDTIGRMGSTGRSTGTHLHFEVRLNGDAVNPRRFLEGRKDAIRTQQIAKARIADTSRQG